MSKQLLKTHFMAGLAMALSGLGLGNGTLRAAVNPQEQVIIVTGQEEGREQQAADVETKQSERLWLGIVLKSIEGDLARYLKNTEGVLVDSVLEGSPAEQAGLEEGDVLMEVDGRKLAGPSELMDVMRSLKQPGGENPELKLKLSRQGEPLELVVTPALRPAEYSEASEFTDSWIEIEGGINLAGVPEAEATLRKLRVGELANQLDLFQFGQPWVIDFEPTVIEEEDESAQSELDVKIKRKLGDEVSEVHVHRPAGKPAKITVKRGDKTDVYGVDEMEKLPADVRGLVRHVLGGQSIWRAEFGPRLRLRESVTSQQLHNEGTQKDDQSPDEKQASGDREHETFRLSEELAAKYRAMAEEMAERAQHEAERLRNKAQATVRDLTEMPQEVEKLREQLKQLREEVETLRAELNRSN